MRKALRLLSPESLISHLEGDIYFARSGSEYCWCFVLGARRKWTERTELRERS